ncbi:TorF family putative porin [Porphyrobacter sp. AAP82]|uniref:TorF family putative porin n=1 Tax=Porphyrobacter sp. AAP82 TaxID=1248917 RepID=UPI0003182B3C|nr:TorF family putative porin [Porphyrobacter sp. AAP82]
MSIRFASAASAVALAACLATPAFAGEAAAAPISPAADTETEITVSDTATAALTPAIAPIDAAELMGQEEDTPAITITGSATLASDYRFRGVSQSDEGMAIQGGFTINHESGAYIGTWGSNLAGWGTFGGSSMELDIYAGYKIPVGEGTLDLGGTWYMYPSGADITDFVEFYAKLGGTVGPVGLTATVAYAPQQEALGNWDPVGPAVDPGDKEDNLYLAADAAYAISGAPVTLKAHLGYSDGNPGLGPNGTSVAPTGTYFDWSLGLDVVPIEHLTLSVAYIDTDIAEADAALIRPNFATLAGDSISDATVVFSVTASF